MGHDPTLRGKNPGRSRRGLILVGGTPKIDKRGLKGGRKWENSGAAQNQKKGGEKRGHPRARADTVIFEFLDWKN